MAYLGVGLGVGAPVRCSGYNLAGFPCSNYCGAYDPYCYNHYNGYYSPAGVWVEPTIGIGLGYGGYGGFREGHGREGHRGGGGEIHSGGHGGGHVGGGGHGGGHGGRR